MPSLARQLAEGTAPVLGRGASSRPFRKDEEENEVVDLRKLGGGQRQPPFFAYGADWAFDFTRDMVWRGNDFRGGLVQAGFTFTRNIAGYARNREGRLELFPANVARRTNKGVLIEPSRVNLGLWSQDFTNAAWVKSSVSVTPNVWGAPDPAFVMDKLVEAAATAAHYVTQTITTTAAAHAISFYARAAERSFVQVSDSVAAGDYINFNLETGVVGAASGYTGKMTEMAGGIWRCEARKTMTAAATGHNIAVVNANTASKLPSYAGDGVSGVYVWGYQQELGAEASSYIPTTTVARTRAVDVLHLPVTGLAYPLSLYGEVSRTIDLGTTQNIIQVDDGTANDRTYLHVSSADLNAGLSQAGGVVQATLTQGTNVLETAVKTALRCELNNVRMAAAGVLSTLDTGAAMPVTPVGIRIGTTAGGGSATGGYVLAAAVYAGGKTDADLIALTS